MEQALFLQPTADVSLSEELAIEALRREESQRVTFFAIFRSILCRRRTKRLFPG